MNESKISLLEALLFLTEDPLPSSQLAKMLDLNQKEVVLLLENLNLKYRQNNHVLTVWSGGGGYQLATVPELSSSLESFYGGRREPSLSRAALEVLALIAHRQPVTRIEIEMVRGVRSQSSLDNLIRRRLIKVCGKKDTPGRPLLYATTDYFLTYFGLSGLEDLPPLDAEGYKEEGPDDIKNNDIN